MSPDDVLRELGFGSEVVEGYKAMREDGLRQLHTQAAREAATRLTGVLHDEAYDVMCERRDEWQRRRQMKCFVLEYWSVKPALEQRWLVLLPLRAGSMTFTSREPAEDWARRIDGLLSEAIRIGERQATSQPVW